MAPGSPAGPPAADGICRASRSPEPGHLPAHLYLACSPGEGACFSPKSLVFPSSQTCWRILLAARGAAFLSRCPRGCWLRAGGTFHRGVRALQARGLPGSPGASWLGQRPDSAHFEERTLVRVKYAAALTTGAGEGARALVCPDAAAALAHRCCCTRRAAPGGARPANSKPAPRCQQLSHRLRKIYLSRRGRLLVWSGKGIVSPELL